jgi:HSP20 family protein
MNTIIKRSLLALGLATLMGPVAAQTSGTAGQSQGAQGQTAQTGPSQQGAPQANAVGNQQAAGEQSWNPWQEFRRMQQQMKRVFEDTFTRLQSQVGPEPLQGEGQGVTVSQLNVQEQGNNYVVKTNIPGVKKGDVNVSLDGRLLRISAQSRSQEPMKGQKGKVVGQETYASNYQRAITLPGPVNASGMHTAFNNGQLTVTIPKTSS